MTEHIPVLLNLPRPTLNRYIAVAINRGLIRDVRDPNLAHHVRHLIEGEVIDAVQHFTPAPEPRLPNGAGQAARKAESRDRNGGVGAHTAAINLPKETA